jgi:hypothetical protein
MTISIVALSRSVMESERVRDVQSSDRYLPAFLLCDYSSIDKFDEKDASLLENAKNRKSIEDDDRMAHWFFSLFSFC